MVRRPLTAAGPDGFSDDPKAAVPGSDTGPPPGRPAPPTTARGGRSAVVRLWRRFLAVTRLSTAAVCEESARLGPYDFHTYADDADGVPWHAQGGARCLRCGKRFRL